MRRPDVLHILRDPLRHARFMLRTGSRSASPPILCPSIGRVGSTLLWQSLVTSRARAMLGDYRPSDWKRVSRSEWDLANARFTAGTVCKTHDFPYALDLSQPLRIVFLFGRPSDVVLSVLRCEQTKGMDWIEDHLRHMHAREPYHRIADQDVLRLEEQVDAWRALRGADIVCLSYDKLWDNRLLLEDFVGFPVRLPPRIERSFDDLPAETVSRVRASYAALDGRIGALPGSQIIRRAG